MGRLIVFEGPDMSGKSTQVHNIVNYLCNRGKNVFTMHFPNYDSPTGAKIKQMLHDPDVDLTSNRDQRFAYAELQVEDKMVFKPQLMQYVADNDYVILDRHIMSSHAFDYASFYSCDQKGAYLNKPGLSFEDDMKHFEMIYPYVMDGLPYENVVFYRSSFIASEADKAPNRVLDNIDKNKDYQRIVNDGYKYAMRSGLHNIIGTIDTDEILQRISDACIAEGKDNASIIDTLKYAITGELISILKI